MPHATPSAGVALLVLHYIGPIAAAVYFLAAKTTASCLLQKPTKSQASRVRQRCTAGLEILVTTTVIAEAVTAVTQAVQRPGWYAAQDYIIYLAISVFLHASLSVGILENPSPLWHLYLGSWLVSWSFDVAIVAVRVPHLLDGTYAWYRVAFNITRVVLLLALCLLGGYFVLQDRRRSVRLDAESEALLAANANGSTSKPAASPADSLFPSETSETSSDDPEDLDSDSDFDFDSDSEEPERDKELRAQRRKRLERSGNWLNYLKEFGIFVPMLVPKKDRRVQCFLFIIGVCIVAQRALNILVPRQIGIITNELTSTAGTGYMPWKAFCMWLLYAALQSEAGVPLIKELLQLPVQQYGFRAITTTSFRHIMGLSMDFHNEKNSGELIRAIEQGTNLQELLAFIFFEVLPMFFDLIVSFFYVSMLFNVYMAMILFVVGVVYVWLGAKVTIWSLKTRRDFNTAIRNESRVQNEAISQWQTVSHFNKTKYESQRYSDTVDDFVRVELRYFIAYYLGGGAQSLVMFIGRILAYLLATYRVVQGYATVGDLITLITYWDSIEGPLSHMSYSFRKISSMLTDSERLLQLLQTKPTIVDKPDAVELNVTAGEVAFKDVAFAYDARKPTLAGVDFVVKPGQTVALVGETGGGKSTILKLLYRYYDVGNGSITIDGRDIRDVTLDSLRDSFGMVPQDSSLFNISLLENIKYGRLDATEEEVQEACKAAAIHDKIMSFPDGYKAKVGERGVKLSGGEQQRVSIARAILRQPKIVLLDEATSMIDAETEALIQMALKRLTADRTTFIVAHRLSTIQHADLILVINDGHIVERGTHEELIQQDGKYVALWSKQRSKDAPDAGPTPAARDDGPPLVESDDESDENGDKSKGDRGQ